MKREIIKALAPLQRRVALMVGRAVLAAVKDGGARQYVQFEALKSEIKDEVERVQQYGVNTVPLSGAQVVFVTIQGNRDHPLAISVDDPRYRPKDWEAGDSGLYTFNATKVHLKADGKVLEIEVDDVLIKATNKVRMETPLLECTGDIRDRCDEQDRSVREMREIYDIHVHPENDSGGPTDIPNQQMGA